MVIDVDVLKTMFSIPKTYDFTNLKIVGPAIIVPESAHSSMSVPICIYNAVVAGKVTVDIASDMMKYYRESTMYNLRKYTLEQRITDISMAYDLTIDDDVMLWVKLQ